MDKHDHKHNKHNHQHDRKHGHEHGQEESAASRHSSEHRSLGQPIAEKGGLDEKAAQSNPQAKEKGVHKEHYKHK